MFTLLVAGLAIAVAQNYKDEPSASSAIDKIARDSKAAASSIVGVLNDVLNGGADPKKAFDKLASGAGVGTKAPQRSSSGSRLLLLLAGVLGFGAVRYLYRRLRAARIRGAKIVITGASSGIGASVAQLCAMLGAESIVLVGRSDKKLDELTHIINRTYPRVARYVATNCANEAEVERLSQAVLSQVGCPDIIIHCAGAGAWKFLDEGPAAELRAALDAPLLSAMLVSRVFLPHMRKRGSGTMVMVQSPAAYCAFGGCTAYTAARWGLRGLVQALQADVRGTKLKVQEVVLGETSSGYWQHNPGSIERMPTISRFLGTITSDEAARYVVRGIESGRKLSVYPMSLWATMIMMDWAPSLVTVIVRLSSVSYSTPLPPPAAAAAAAAAGSAAHL